LHDGQLIGAIPVPTSRRSVLSAIGAGAASTLAVGCATRAAADTAVADLVQRSADSNAALMRGDLGAYRALISYTDDFTLMSPFGGTPSRGADYTPERMEAMARFFRNGTFEQEIVETYASRDMVVLVLIEKQNVQVGGLPAQNWPLRVTLVYRRVDGEWRLAHRHADPLVAGVSLATAAALARGDIR
jgi:ketosteroid isomerase-like protein